MITVLSGGGGAARLLRALSGETDPRDLRAVVNVGDDLVMHGLTICPDLDTITYTLAGLNNDELGWGLQDESWRVMSELERLGGESWFRLGDRDLATHLYRSQRLSEGATKTEVTQELCDHWGVQIELLPASNDPVATVFDTDEGTLSFQQYFVQRHHDVTVRAITVRGAQDAMATPEVLDALRNAERLVIAPSNPLISIEPILQIPEIRDVVRARRDDVVAISPLINGAAVKGPADRLLRELGYDATSEGVAKYYEGLIGTMIIDEVDRAQAPSIERLGVRVKVTTTLMAESSNASRLAQAVLE